MTNTNWRKLLKKFIVVHNNAFDGDLRYDYELIEADPKDIEDFIDLCLKSQKAKLLEKMEKEKKDIFFEDLDTGIGIDRLEEENHKRHGFNDCLEIIKGLIKGK